MTTKTKRATTKKKVASKSTKVAADAAGAELPKPDANTVVPPRVGETWLGQGGRFAGIALNDEGTEDHYLVIYDGLYKGEASLKDMEKWASKLSADGHKDFTLPTKSEGPIAYATLGNTLFKDGGWYWTKTRHADDGSYAWYQSFDDGYQDGDRVGGKLRGCAVRRIKIIR